jgi:ribosomal protein S18 acetylase RimI-like enzyme
MHVRSFSLADYAAVTVLLQSVLSEMCFQETIEAFARQLSWEPSLVLVAEDELGAIIGVIIGTVDINTNDGYYYRIAVHNDCQRQGIGKALVQRLKLRFDRRKVTRILITADEHNIPYLALFESIGFSDQDYLRVNNQKLSKIGRAHV